MTTFDDDLPDDDEGLPPGLPGAIPELALQRKDLRELARGLTVLEVRYVVDLYYAWQRFRIASGNQVAALTRSGEPHAAIAWTQGRLLSLEKDVQAMLDAFTRHEPTGMGAWARGICGIGPVIAAGLIAHVDVTRAPTVGHVWRFAGLDPTTTWERGTKRPWNASLKVLAFKAGESFVKVQGRRADVYGKVYAARKAEEAAKNAAGAYAEQARAALARLKREDTVARKAYQEGQLPPGHLHARARRYATKLFLAHWWEEAYVRHYGKAPPLPYPVVHLGHAHVIGRPNPTVPAGAAAGSG